MNIYTVVLDQEVAGTMRSNVYPEIGEYATIRYYNCTGDVKVREGVITDIVEDEE